MKHARTISKLMKTRSIQARSLLKISLISFSFASVASFCVLATFTAGGLGSLSVQIMPITVLAICLGVIQSAGVALTVYWLFLRPLHQLEQEMATLAADPELILPTDEDITGHNQDIALALGGRLRLSRSTDEGSEFRLQLPAGCLLA